MGAWRRAGRRRGTDVGVAVGVAVLSGLNVGVPVTVGVGVGVGPSPSPSQPLAAPMTMSKTTTGMATCHHERRLLYQSQLVLNITIPYINCLILYRLSRTLVKRHYAIAPI